MSESMIERVAHAIEATMFAPHELPCDPELHAKYLDTARAAIEAMREPTKAQLEAMEPWSRVSGHHEMAWKAGINAALIWPAGSADRAGVPLARD